MKISQKHTLLIILFLFVIVGSSCIKNNKQEVSKFKAQSPVNELNRQLDSVKSKNSFRISSKKNVTEVYHNFIEKNQGKNYIGDKIDVDLSMSSGAMISAYSHAIEDYAISMRIKESGNWSDWKKMKINEEVKNPNRKVFSPKNLSNTVTGVQFRSNKQISQEVVFRIYKFKK